MHGLRYTLGDLIIILDTDLAHHVNFVFKVA